MTSRIFGPVPSRRLGRSLGVDLVPLKTCSYDCIYCQLGRTTLKTIERKEWVPLEEILDELPRHLGSQPDYITLSGSGEPTLYSRLAELIDRIKSMTSIPVAVLTNGSLLWDPQLRDQLMRADLIVPSLDAGNAAMFQRINRPDHQIAFTQMLDGLIQMRRQYRGPYWLEVLLVHNYTSEPDEFAQLDQCIRRIRPDRVQLGTVRRPGAEPDALAVSAERLAALAATSHADPEIIADRPDAGPQRTLPAGCDDVLQLLKRRPCSLSDIVGGLAMHPNEALKYLQRLLDEGRVEQTQVDTRQFYQARGR